MTAAVVFMSLRLTVAFLLRLRVDVFAVIYRCVYRAVIVLLRLMFYLPFRLRVLAHVTALFVAFRCSAVSGACNGYVQRHDASRGGENGQEIPPSSRYRAGETQGGVRLLSLVFFSRFFCFLGWEVQNEGMTYYQYVIVLSLFLQTVSFFCYFWLLCPSYSYSINSTCIRRDVYFPN